MEEDRLNAIREFRPQSLVEALVGVVVLLIFGLIVFELLTVAT